ncbi:MAG: hypothetical protein Q9220_004404 [cf. Caloplaca sp. 1 TL-2023]
MGSLASDPQTKVNIFIVPGTWLSPEAYASFASHLRVAGYGAYIASLPSFDPKNANVDCALDTGAVRRQLLTKLDSEGTDIIIFAHSYGGIPAGGAVLGLDKASRAQQKRSGGVLGMIYMAAFIVPEGATLSAYLGGRNPPYIVRDQLSKGLCEITGAREVLYADVDEAMAKGQDHLLGPHAMLVFESPAPVSAWKLPEFQGKLLFLKCLLDRAMPAPLQDKLIKRSDVSWLVRDINASHCAFASQPHEVVKLLGEFVRRLKQDELPA